MFDDSGLKTLCVCGHTLGYHDGESYLVAAGVGGSVYRCCAGNWPNRHCKCPRFRIAIAQVLDVEVVEDPGST